MCKKNENKMYATPKYKCAICDEIYDEEKKAAEAKKKAEKDARQQEVTAALDNALTLVNKFIEDYGSYKYNGKLKDLDLVNMDFFPSKLWHHFWF